MISKETKAKEAEQEAKFVIARRILNENAERAEELERQAVAVDDVIKEKAAARSRLVRTNQLLASYTDHALYTMGEERQMVSDERMSGVIWELERQAERETSVDALVAIVRRTLTACLFGCNVNIGIAPDTYASSLVFPEEDGVVRKEVRGRSILFECLNQKDIVVQASISASTEDGDNDTASVKGRQNASSKPKGKGKGKGKETVQLRTGETVTYVPLLSRGGGVGVMEIHGLQTSGLTSHRKYERDTSALEAMVQAEDLRYVMCHVQ